MNQSNPIKDPRAFTLIEVLCAMAVLAIVLIFVSPSLVQQMKANRFGQIRAEAAQAAQTVIDEIRYLEVGTLPTSGSDPVKTVTINDKRDYNVTVTYCLISSYCTSNDTRHLTVDVTFKGDTVYSTETVFSGLGSASGGSSSSSGGGGAGGSSSSSSSSSSSASSSSSSASSSSSSSSSSASSSSSSSTSGRGRGRGRGRGGRTFRSGFRS